MKKPRKQPGRKKGEETKIKKIVGELSRGKLKAREIAERNDVSLSYVYILKKKYIIEPRCEMALLPKADREKIKQAEHTVQSLIRDLRGDVDNTRELEIKLLDLLSKNPTYEVVRRVKKNGKASYEKFEVEYSLHEKIKMLEMIIKVQDTRIKNQLGIYGIKEVPNIDEENGRSGITGLTISFKAAKAGLLGLSSDKDDSDGVIDVTPQKAPEHDTDEATDKEPDEYEAMYAGKNKPIIIGPNDGPISFDDGFINKN